MTKDTRPKTTLPVQVLPRCTTRTRMMGKHHAIGLIFGITLGASATYAVAGPEVASAVTQYDRQNTAQNNNPDQASGNSGGGRAEPWERLDMTQEVDAIQGLDAEIGSSGVSTQDAQADHLFNRMKDDPEWLTLKGQVDNYANREEDLEFRVDRLETLDYNWEPAETLASGWNFLGATPTGNWTPAISNQKTNFTQTIDRVLSYNKKLEEQERNIVTGEIKTVKESYITKTENDIISRDIEVNFTPWAKAGDNTEERTINYVVASTGHLVGTRKETKEVSECQYDILSSEAKFAHNNSGQIPKLLARSNIPSYHRSAIVFVDRSKEQNKAYNGSGGPWYPKQPNEIMYHGEVYWAGNDSYQPGASNVFIMNNQRRMLDIVISNALNYSGGFLEEWLIVPSSGSTTKASQLNAFSPPTKANPLIGADGYKYWAGRLMATPSWSTTTNNFKGTVKAQIYEVCRSKN